MKEKRERFPLRKTIISTLTLALVAGLTTAALAFTNAVTKDRIREYEQKSQMQGQLEVIDADAFEARQITLDGEPVEYQAALRNGELVGYVFATEGVGNSSGMMLLTGVSAEGKITGIKIMKDNETAGFTNRLKSKGYLDSFVGVGAKEPLELGNQVDAVGGATKSSRGVLRGVNKALEIYRQIQDFGKEG